MTLSLTEIDAVVAELAEALAGGVLVGADPLPGPALLLRFDVAGSVRRVLVSARVYMSRLNLSSRRYDPAEADRAPAQDRIFAERVRRELRGAKVTSVKRVVKDRVVAFNLESGDRKRKILFECSGQHPNVFLCDDRNVILAMLAQTKSQRRDLRPGARYEKPLQHEHDSVETLRFVGQGGSVSARIEEHYDGEEAREERVRTVGSLRASLKTALERQERLIEAIEGDLAKARAGAGDPGVAEAAGPAETTNPAEPVAPAEAASPVESVVPSEPAAPVEEAGAAPGEGVVVPEAPVARGSVRWQERRLLQARATAQHLQQMLTGMAEGDASALEAARRYVEATLAPPLVVRGGASGGREDAARSDRPGERPFDRQGPAPTGALGVTLPPGVRRFRAQDGTPIWVATNPAIAPHLTFGVAQDDDLWLRVDGATGAHVVVACAGQHEPPFATLVDAGLLAVHFSRADALSEQPVQVARRRDVRSGGRSAPPDEVQVRRSRVFTIRPDKARLAAILASEGRGGAPGRGARPGSERPMRGDPSRPPRPGTGRPPREGGDRPWASRPPRDGAERPGSPRPPRPVREDAPPRSPRPDAPARPPRPPRDDSAPRPPRPPRRDSPARGDSAPPKAPGRRRYPAGTRGPERT